MKRIIIVIACVVMLAGLTYALLCTLSSQNDMKASRPDGLIGVLPLVDQKVKVEPVPGLIFKFDTGSDISTITDSDLQLLRDMGMSVEKKIYPVAGRDGNGRTRICLTRYTVSLPLYDYRFLTDSVSGKVRAVADKASLNVLEGVDFAPSQTGYSVLGVDFIEKFKVAYDYMNGAVRLYFALPQGYEAFNKIYYSRAATDGLWLGKRYYMDMRVDGEMRGFFCDTGIREAMVKMSTSTMSKDTQGILNDTVVTMVSEYPALKNDSEWMEIGSRGGNVKVYYYDNREEPFAFNPLNLFRQDCMIDFAAGEVYLRRYFDVPDQDPPLASSVEIAD